ncbi:MAG: Uma2 family endonuclease [Dehalococcoidia bacterium]|nr:Uma2 family endonuclease [Dehalococcoidia bacterium]
MSLQQVTTYRADYIWETPDDGYRYEVIDSVLYVTGTPWRRHQWTSGCLCAMLDAHVQPERRGQLYFNLGVALDDVTSVVPDLLYVSRERESLLSDRGVEGPPDLAVEVLSPSTRRTDRVVKFERYARAGVPHYWIIDPIALTLEAYELRQGTYMLTADLRDEDHFSPTLFPGLTIPLSGLWL